VPRRRCSWSISTRCSKESAGTSPCEHVACTFYANVLTLLTWKGNRERLGESQPLTRVATLDARNCLGALGVCIVTTVFSAYSLEVLLRISFLSTAIVVHDATF
jgi:hypothetical protein